MSDRTIEEIARACYDRLPNQPAAVATATVVGMIATHIREAVANETADLRGQLEIARATLRRLGEECKRLADANEVVLGLMTKGGV